MSDSFVIKYDGEKKKDCIYVKPGQSQNIIIVNASGDNDVIVHISVKDADDRS